MADRTWTPTAQSLLKKRVTAFAVIDFGGTGAPTLKAWTPGGAQQVSGYADASTTAPNPFSTAGTQLVASIARNSAGNFTLVLQDSYQRFLGGRGSFLVPTTGIPAAPIIGFVPPAGGVDNPGPISSINFVTQAAQLTKAQIDGDATVTLAQVATDPASGEQLILQLELDDSSSI